MLKLMLVHGDYGGLIGLNAGEHFGEVHPA